MHFGRGCLHKQLCLKMKKNSKNDLKMQPAEGLFIRGKLSLYIYVYILKLYQPLNSHHVALTEPMNHHLHFLLATDFNYPQKKR